ncbi:hypothetical protein Scep_028579 [Stephania cephalantha]|uniref:Uncharacterized protein n=1 Tax=Stephania cephalantha TaxID=152367 RepID=A0AAP0EDE8_9MAGN
MDQESTTTSGVDGSVAVAQRSGARAGGSREATRPALRGGGWQCNGEANGASSHESTESGSQRSAVAISAAVADETEEDDLGHDCGARLDGRRRWGRFRRRQRAVSGGRQRRWWRRRQRRSGERPARVVGRRMRLIRRNRDDAMEVSFIVVHAFVMIAIVEIVIDRVGPMASESQFLFICDMSSYPDAADISQLSALIGGDLEEQQWLLRRRGRHVVDILDQWKAAKWRAAGMDETRTRRASIWETWYGSRGRIGGCDAK